MSIKFLRFNHHIVDATVGQIVQQADKYFSAITMSLRDAREGCTFADNTIEICKSLSKGQTSIESMTFFLADMLELANKAHDDAVETNKRFREARRGFLEVSTASTWVTMRPAYVVPIRSPKTYLSK